MGTITTADMNIACSVAVDSGERSPAPSSTRRRRSALVSRLLLGSPQVLEMTARLSEEAEAR